MVAKTSSPSEAVIQHSVRLAIGGDPRAVVWRNNIGTARHFNAPGDQCPNCKCKLDIRRVEYGLTKGSADLIGLTDSGRFIGLEIKSASGRISPEQKMWLELVRSKGGIAEVVRSPEEALAILEK